jgi:hypothetical protein
MMSLLQGFGIVKNRVGVDVLCGGHQTPMRGRYCASWWRFSHRSDQSPLRGRNASNNPYSLWPAYSVQHCQTEPTASEKLIHTISSYDGLSTPRQTCFLCKYFGFKYMVRLSWFWPERRIGQRRGATRAPTQGPRRWAGMGVSSPFFFVHRIGRKAINPSSVSCGRLRLSVFPIGEIFPDPVVLERQVD